MKKENGKEQSIHLVQSGNHKIYQIIITGILVVMALVCFLPFWYIICQSFSSNEAIRAGKVGLLPVDFTWNSYLYVLQRAPFWKAFGITIVRVVLGLPLNLFMIITAAYPYRRIIISLKRVVYMFGYFFLPCFLTVV